MIRTIGLSDLYRALRLGWEDFKAVPSHAIVLCVIYPVLGLVLARTVLGYSVLPLLFPLAAGFALLGPFAALGLYELSRRRERGEQASAWDAVDVLRSPSFGAMLGVGTLLLALFVVWIATAQAIYVAAFGYETAAGIPDFARRVLTTPQGWWLIVAGCSVGFLFALVALCVSVVSFPLMLDRHAGAGDAMVTSLRTVARNPVPMAAWGLIVAVLLLLGSLPFFLGLAIVIPLLGHATWHLYREVIEAGTQSATAASPPDARAAFGGGFPGQLVPVAAQERRIAQPEKLAVITTAGRLPTGGLAADPPNDDQLGQSLVLAAVAADISQNELSIPIQGHRVECCPDDVDEHPCSRRCPAAPAASGRGSTISRMTPRPRASRSPRSPPALAA